MDPHHHASAETDVVNDRGTGRCRVCAGARGTTYGASEKMFGFGGRFEYLECEGCGCVQLTTPPADLAPYYPPTYYSFQQADPEDLLPTGTWRSRLFRVRNQAQFFGGLLGPLARKRARPDFAWVSPLLRHTGVRRLDAKILDVGCGSGWLLKRLRQAGFTRLVGCDPFLAAPIDIRPELRILPCAVDALTPREAESFDLVMFHHSLEHMTDPIAPLRAAASLLKRGGRCLVAIPVAASEAWETYRTDWVELDAPRHFFLHTLRSFELAARAAGLRVEHITQDGGAFEFWGSELYRRGHTLVTSTGGARDLHDFFTPDEQQAFTQRAAEANARGRGGRAIFYCVRS